MAGEQRSHLIMATRSKKGLCSQKETVWGHAEEEGTQEARKPKGLHVLRKPTPQEEAPQKIAYVPYRSWCSPCAKDKGKSDKAQAPGPLLQMDYVSINTEDDDTKATVLTCLDFQTGLSLAIAVDEKGVTPYAPHELKKFVHEVGRASYTVRTGQDPAIKQLAQRLIKEMEGTSLKHSSMHHSQLHGSVER